MQGTIKFFDKKKGWGYIKADDGKEYFFHYTQIQIKGISRWIAVILFHLKQVNRMKRGASRQSM